MSTLTTPATTLPFPVLEAADAAALINHGDTIGFSGFTPAGTPKAVSRALALRAEEQHAAGNPFQVGVVTGASTGPSVDGALAAANAISFRTPYQSDPALRQRINTGETHFFDMHLSMLPQNVRYGFLGKFSWAIIEACDVTADGQIILTSAVGASPTFCRVADRIIIELNRHHPAALRGFHDIYEPVDPPHRSFIPVFSPSDRAGTPYIRVDPKKIAGVVLTVWCYYFFRDPPRVTPVRAGLVVSPADGAVSMIAPAAPPPELGLGGGLRTRVSIFMNVFDCHVNRAPVALTSKVCARTGRLRVSMNRGSTVESRIAKSPTGVTTSGR